MKKIFIIIILTFTTASIFGQSKIIELKKNKITQLIFPKTITSTKLSLQDKISHAVEDNVIYLQPTIEFIDESNITIITDNVYYGFNIIYNDDTNVFHQLITEDMALYSSSANISKKIADTIATKHNFNKVLNSNNFLFENNTAKVNKVHLILNGIYTDEKFTYLKIEITNDTQVNYDIEYFTFIISAKEKGTRTTDEQLQLFPSGISPELKLVPAKGDETFVFAFEKFNFNPEKILYIDIIEKNGERNITLPVKANIIFKTKSL